jgi:hypothetical protein
MPKGVEHFWHQSYMLEDEFVINSKMPAPVSAVAAAVYLPRLWDWTWLKLFDETLIAVVKWTHGHFRRFSF